MNVPYLKQAVDALDAALGATINGEHRKAIARAANEVLCVLQAQGCFFGVSKALQETIRETTNTQTK